MIDEFKRLEDLVMQVTDPSLQAKLRSQLSILHDQLEAYQADSDRVDGTLSEQLQVIETLTEEKARKDNVQMDFDSNEGVYWQPGRNGPFCAVCYDKDKKLIRLHDGRDYVNQTRWICKVCQKTFG